MFFRVVWQGPAVETSLLLEVSNLGGAENFAQELTDISPRGTKTARFRLDPNIAAGESRTYQLTLRNASACPVPLAHVYRTGGFGTFDEPDPHYTVPFTPVVADSAIAVGAWTSRDRYTNWRGEEIDVDFFESPYSLTVNTLAFFSSRGPRIDGKRLPAIAAPGIFTISCLDSESEFQQGPGAETHYIDNDGMNLDGSGPANYIAFAGTSMASPLAAGAAALLLEEDPTLTPAQVKLALQATASQASSPDNDAGFGLIDIREAIRFAQSGIPDDCDIGDASFVDCNGNALPDLCDIVTGVATDCNRNDIPDSCEIADGTVADCNLNGLPDTCDLGGTFEAGELQTFSAGNSPRDVVAADFDGDGTIDLATANATSDDITVLLSSAGGLFTGRADYPAGDRPLALVAGDLDGNGSPDLVVANGRDDTISVCLNDGRGAFENRDDISVVPEGEEPADLVLEDLDRDGTLDLAVLNSDSSNVAVFTSAGDGSFGAPRFFDTVDSPGAIAAGDVNGDSLVDLLVASERARTLHVHLHRAGGTFEPGAALTGLVGVRGLALGDLDRDQDIDLVTTNWSCGKVQVWTNSGTGEFSEMAELTVGEAPEKVVLVDLNHDGFPDVVTANSRTNDASVLLNLQGSRFAPALSLAAGTTPSNLLGADVDGDGLTDVVITDARGDSISLHLNEGAPGSSLDCNSNGIPDGCDIAAGTSPDANGNGVPDSCEGGLRLPGDCNEDGSLDISDAICVFGVLFLGTPSAFPCGDGLPGDEGNLALTDWQPDGGVDLSDGVALLQFLFGGGSPHPLADPGSPSTTCVFILGCSTGKVCED